MARMAVLAGRTVSDLARNVMILLIITVVGIAVGFRPHGSIVAYIQACLLALIFAYCLSWGFAFIGLAAPNSETAQAMTFPLIFPLTFASSIFVPVATMPSWLRGFATYQPVSETTEAVRGLMSGTPHGNSTWISLAWAASQFSCSRPSRSPSTAKRPRRRGGPRRRAAPGDPRGVLSRHRRPRVEQVDGDTVQLCQPVSDRHGRPGGTLSGPTMMMLADTAAWMAILAQIGPVLLAVTTSLHIDFLRKPDIDDLMARATVLKLGRKLAVVDVPLFSRGHDELVAKAQVTYSLPSRRDEPEPVTNLPPVGRSRDH